MKMNYRIMIKYLLFTGCILLYNPSFSQKTDPKWDETKTEKWPEGFLEVDIKSSLDGKNQKAYFQKSQKAGKQPLVVSLHTWSGDYTQKDTLALVCRSKGYHYIHPNFRGPNTNFEACGSAAAIQDIDDAIDFAIREAKVDLNNIHVIGASGGGYATLLAYMNSKHQIKTFSSWVPISNLEEWYYQSKARGNKYAFHIAKATHEQHNFTPDKFELNKDEARKRSPFFMETPIKKRENSQLHIYAGVHDGYTGSVPITQSLQFYNKLVMDIAPASQHELIPLEDIIVLLANRSYPSGLKGKLGNRQIHYQKQLKDSVSITIFEGGHEMLPYIALDHL